MTIFVFCCEGSLSYVDLVDGKAGRLCEEQGSVRLYNNASEVVREALRLKIAADETDKMMLQRLYAAIEPAWQQAECGDLVPFVSDPWRFSASL